MMRNDKQRVLVAKAATITMTACGMVAGYLLGCALAIHLADNWLNQYLKLIAVQEDASFKEARASLAVLKNSPFPSCSDAEISHFRELVFRSEYLKDAGRIHSEKIDCSAAEGHPQRAMEQFKRGSKSQDGAVSYSNLVSARDDSLKRAGLQLGNIYVVYGSQIPAVPGPVPMRLTVALKDAVGQQPADVPKGSQPALVTDGTKRVNDTLYATGCSAFQYNCVTASTTVAEALNAESGAIAGSSALGGFLGALIGMALSFVYRRSRNLEQQLRRAIAHDDLQVAYQPIVSLASGRIVGAEALARWTNDEGSPVGPDVFIKLAEEHGFVGSITKLVVRRALNAFANTLRNHPGFRLSVNVAAADLADPSFLPMLDASLDRAKVASKSLVIEITESSTANREVAMETIRTLRRRGHSIHRRLRHRLFEPVVFALSFRGYDQDRQGLHPGHRHRCGNRGYSSADSGNGCFTAVGSRRRRGRNQSTGRLFLQRQTADLCSGLALWAAGVRRRISWNAGQGGGEARRFPGGDRGLDRGRHAGCPHCLTAPAPYSCPILKQTP